MRAGFVNITSLTKYIVQLRQYLKLHRTLCLFGVAESRLDHRIADDFAKLKIAGFSALRVDTNKRGGGLTLFVHNSLKAKLVAVSDTATPRKLGTVEYMLCSIQQGDSAPALVALIYRPPDVALAEFSIFEGQLASFACDFSHKIIMGDFNTNILDADESKYIKRLAGDFFLKAVDHSATHHTTDAHTRIDISW